MPPQPIPAVWMRGGRCKGLFLRADDLPRDYDERMQLLARLVGSPDPHGTQLDGLGGGTPGTSQVVVLSRSRRLRHDLDCWCAQVDPITGLMDSGLACGDLIAAVGPAAVWLKLIEPQGEHAALRIWQLHAGQTVEARFALHHGEPLESGTFKDEGVPFAAAAIDLTVFAPEGDAAAADDGDGDGGGGGGGGSGSDIDTATSPTRRTSSARRLMQGVVVPI